MTDFLIHLVDRDAWVTLFLLIWLTGCIAGVIRFLVWRAYRMVQVIFRGWPPPHLDADGDWKPKPENR